MKYERELELLRKILQATIDGTLVWEQDDDKEWYTASITDGRFLVSFRYLYIESINQIGADPDMIEFILQADEESKSSGCRGLFAAGTEGYCVFREILWLAFEKLSLEEMERRLQNSLEFLDKAIEIGPAPRDHS